MGLQELQQRRTSVQAIVHSCIPYDGLLVERNGRGLNTNSHTG